MKVTHSIEEGEWEDLVQRSQRPSVFQTPECLKLYAECGEYEVFLTAVRDDNGRVKGVVTGAVHKNGVWPFKRMTSRAIVFGGPLLAEDATEEEVEALLQGTNETVRRKCVYLEYRFTEDYSRCYDVFRRAGLRITEELDAVVQTSSHQAMWSSIQKRKRRQIKAALKRGVEIKETATEEEIRRYYPMVRRLHWRVSHKPMPSVEFFVKLAKSEIGRVMMVNHEGEVIGFSAALILKGRKLYHLYAVGEDQRYRELAPSSVGLYGMLKWAAENDIPECDLMGAGVPNKPYGVREFKKRMGARIIQSNRAIIVFDKLIYKIGSLIYNS